MMRLIRKLIKGPKLTKELNKLSKRGHPRATLIHEVHEVLLNSLSRVKHPNARKYLEEIRRLGEEVLGRNHNLENVLNSLHVDQGEIWSIYKGRVGELLASYEKAKETSSTEELTMLESLKKAIKMMESEMPDIEAGRTLWERQKEFLEKKLGIDLSKIVSDMSLHETNLLYLAISHMLLLRYLVEAAKKRG